MEARTGGELSAEPSGDARRASPNSQPSPARRRSALRRAVRAKRNGTEEHDRPGRGRARAGAPAGGARRGTRSRPWESPDGAVGGWRTPARTKNQMCARRTRVAHATREQAASGRLASAEFAVLCISLACEIPRTANKTTPKPNICCRATLHLATPTPSLVLASSPHCTLSRLRTREAKPVSRTHGRHHHSRHSSLTRTQRHTLKRSQVRRKHACPASLGAHHRVSRRAPPQHMPAAARALRRLVLRSGVPRSRPARQSRRQSRQTAPHDRARRKCTGHARRSTPPSPAPR